MGLLSKSLASRKKFSGTNTAILEALLTMNKKGNLSYEDNVSILIPLKIYDEIQRQGLYKEIPRQRKFRRETDYADSK